MAESNQDQYESWNEENVRLGELNRKNYLGNTKGDISTFKNSTANLEMPIIP